MVYCSSEPASIENGTQHTATAAVTWAKRPPPSSRAISPASSVASACASAEGARRNWIALYTVARREVVRILRIWGQTLVPPAITMTLYFLIFGGLIGSRVGEM